MGTRADFYVGRGEQAEWLGSVAMDGHPTGIWCGGHHEDDLSKIPILNAANEQVYRERVAELIAFWRHGTTPDQGWPWPWDDSRTTDYAYAFDGGKVWVSCFGHGWLDVEAVAAEKDWEDAKTAVFPNMAAKKNVTMGERSGVMIFTSK